MHIDLEVSPEQASLLKRQAAAAGLDLQSFILTAVEEKLGPAESQPDNAGALSYEQWKREFDDWRSRLRTRNPHFDDSRESIYP